MEKVNDLLELIELDDDEIVAVSGGQNFSGNFAFGATGSAFQFGGNTTVGNVTSGNVTIGV